MVSHHVTHYFQKKPLTPLVTTEVSVDLRGRTFLFITGSSVFSHGKVDQGSELLVQSAVITGNKVLDLGCGWGYVGICIKYLHPECTVTLSDINERAVDFAKQNAVRNHVALEIVQSDGFEKLPLMFDTILLNPPQHAGKEICLELMRQACEHLRAGGTLQIVARHGKGGKGYSKYLEELFGNVMQVARKSGFTVYLAVKQ